MLASCPTIVACFVPPLQCLTVRTCYLKFTCWLRTRRTRFWRLPRLGSCVLMTLSFSFSFPVSPVPCVRSPNLPSLKLQGFRAVSCVNALLLFVVVHALPWLSFSLFLYLSLFCLHLRLESCVAELGKPLRLISGLF